LDDAMTDADGDAEAGSGAGFDGSDGTADRAYLDSVMAEIDEEVRRRRASGDLPVRVERELDELFLEFSPVAGRGGSLAEALRLVDGAAYIDPVVPVESNQPGGAAVKKGLRQLSLWYMGYVTHQVSQFAAAVSRALHLLEDQVADLQRQVERQQVAPAPVVELPWAHGADSWWVPEAVAAFAGCRGRVLHAASGDGWLVRRLSAEGVDAFGVDPRPGRADQAEVEGTDLREEPLDEHLRATESAALGGLVLSGLVDGVSAGEREQLLALVLDRLSPDAALVVHSISPAGWAADEVPPEVDLAPGRPLRAATWSAVLGAAGYRVSVHAGPTGADYLVVAVPHGPAPATPAP
jgi:hypothetical protein